MIKDRALHLLARLRRHRHHRGMYLAVQHREELRYLRGLQAVGGIDQLRLGKS